MKLATFFEKFDQFADAADAVAKMRKLILQLAVRGMLADQSPDDVPALEMLKRNTRAVMPLRIDSGVALPAGWCSVPLGCVIASNTGGGTPSKNNASYWGGSIPWATVKDIQEDRYLYETVDTITEEGLRNSSSNLIPANRLIVVTRMGLGKLMINKIAVAINQDLRAIEPIECLDLEYSYLLFKSLELVGKGVTVKGITVGELHSLPISLPPVVEQRRIVGKVNDLMALCDLLEAQQEERETRHAALSHAAVVRFDEDPTPANLNVLFHPSYSIPPADLRNTILNLAILGKLVPIQRDIDDSGAIFDGLVTIKKAANEETSLPESWALASFRNLTSLVTSGSRGWKDYYSDSGSIFVRTQNIKTDRLVLDDIAHVNLPSSVEGLRAEIKKNDILITITGANVTKAARVEDDIPEAYVSQHIALTRPRWPDMSPWLHLCFIAPGSARGKLEALAYGDKPGLNLNNIRDLVFPIPPLSEQRLIIAEVDRLMKVVGRLEMLVSESQLQAEQLLDAVVHELLHPAADTIEFPRTEPDRASQRAAIGCYAIQHLARNPSFGRTMLMKAFYLAETHLGLPLGWQPVRQAAGPWDPRLQDFESLGTHSEWFTVTENTLKNGHTKIGYSPKKDLKTRAAEAVTLLGSKRTEFDRLLDLFADKNTEEAEIITTLFAAWNDLLIDGKSPGDHEIIHEVRMNWHPDKARFSPPRLQQWLDWIRANGLRPCAHQPRTRQQLMLRLT